MVTIAGRLVRVLLLLLVGSACYRPTQPDCGFVCGPNGACPSGYTCARDQRCHRDGTPASLVCAVDAAPADVAIDTKLPDAR